MIHKNTSGANVKEKSLDAVFSPHKFVPSIIAEQADIDELWQHKRPLLFAHLSHLAYHNQSEAKLYLNQMGVQHSCFYDQKGAQAFLAIWPHDAVLAFRGSQSLEHGVRDLPKLGLIKKLSLKKQFRQLIDENMLRQMSNDILADLQFIPKPLPEHTDVRVHQGFLKEINKLWPAIVLDIEQSCSTQRVWVTGHSLGGAMATLAGMRYPFEGVITFGEPRVGDNIELAFKAKFHHRYINGRDPVTMVPPELPFGYDHHGTAIRIGDPDGKKDFRYDHSILYYALNLQRCADTGAVSNHQPDADTH